MPSNADFLARVDAFVAERVRPCTFHWERDQAFPDEIWPALGAQGFLRLTLPEDQGGRSCRDYCEVIRRLAWGDPALAMNVAAVNALVVAHLDRFATEEQKAKYLEGAASGEIRLAWALTEPDAGSDARRVRTAATNERDGWADLNGRKMFITNGGKAHLIVVLARTDDGLGAYLLETTDPGFVIEERIETIGVSASNTIQFRLENARGWRTPCRFEEAIGLLYRGRLGIAAMALGVAEAAHREAVAWSKEREQFNRRLCDMQSVQNMLADSEMEITAARLLIEDGADRHDRGEDVVKASSMAKLYASETAQRVTNRSVQIHGGRGMRKDNLVQKLWRDAKLTEIGEGCSEIQRMVIAKQVVR